MSEMTEFIPKPVLDAIGHHFKVTGRRAHHKWSINQAHEDALTGALFADLTTRRLRTTFANGKRWRWGVTATKFGSGGKASEEKKSGADGIVEIELENLESGMCQHKSMLIQAKKGWTGMDSKLLHQVSDMENLAPGATGLFDYSSNGYHGIDGREVIHAEGNRRHIPNLLTGVGDFLADRFLVCKVGMRGMYFDANRRLLYLPHRASALKLKISRRLRVRICEPAE